MNVLELLKDAWDGTLTNLRRYRDELRHLSVVMREEHLPRFKGGKWDLRWPDNYFHLTRNLFTETFRACPRTLSGLFIIWLAWKLLTAVF